MPKLPEPDGWFFSEEGRMSETHQYEIETVRAIQEEAYKAGMAAQVRVSIPTAALEHEFARHYDRGHKAGISSAACAFSRIEALEAALRQARAALVYHTEQTRSIGVTGVAISDIDDLLKD